MDRGRVVFIGAARVQSPPPSHASPLRFAPPRHPPYRPSSAPCAIRPTACRFLPGPDHYDCSFRCYFSRSMAIYHRATGLPLVSFPLFSPCPIDLIIVAYKGRSSPSPSPYLYPPTRATAPLSPSPTIPTPFLPAIACEVRASLYPTPALPPNHHVRGNRYISSPLLLTKPAVPDPSPLTTFSCITPLPGAPHSWPPAGFGVLPPPAPWRPLLLFHLPPGALLPPSLPCSVSYLSPRSAHSLKHLMCNVISLLRFCIPILVPFRSLFQMVRNGPP